MVTVPRNKGSYTKRKNREAWQIKYPTGWSNSAGRYTEYREEVSSEAEAISVIKEINDFIYRGGKPEELAAFRKRKSFEVEGNTITFYDFSKEYMRIRAAQGNLAKRTIESDAGYIKKLSPYIGGMPLKSITPKDIDETYASLRSVDKNPIGGTYLQKIHITLSMIFKKAIDYGYIETNPCEKIAKPKRDTKEKEALSVVDAQTLISTIVSLEPSSKMTGILICLGTGIRLSEMLALTWADLDNGFFLISKSMEKDSHHTKKTKTGDSRKIPCPTFLLDVLADWKTEQARQFQRMGLKQTSKTPIVSNSDGSYTLSSVYGRWFRKARKELPIPNHFQFHWLRHTFTTLMLVDYGTDTRTAMGLTGHKSLQVLQGYAHTNEAHMVEAIERLNSGLTPSSIGAKCCNCVYWTYSPVKHQEGACWKSGLPVVVKSDSSCRQGRFAKIGEN